MDVGDVFKKAIERHRASEEQPKNAESRLSQGTHRDQPRERASSGSFSLGAQPAAAKASHFRKKRQNPFTTEAFDDESQSNTTQQSSNGGYFDIDATTSSPLSPQSSQPKTPMRGPFFLSEVERGSKQIKNQSSRQPSRTRILPQLPQQSLEQSVISQQTRSIDSVAPPIRASEDQGSAVQEATIHEEPAEVEEEVSAPSQSIASRLLQRRGSTGMLHSRTPPRRRSSGGAPSSLKSPNEASAASTGGFLARMSRPSSRLPDDIQEDGNQDDGQQHQSIKSPASSKGWNVLRSKVIHGQEGEIRKLHGKDISKGLSGHDMVTELTCGHLPVMMVKMAMDRDDHDVQRIPILLNYLKLRITDSIYPFSNNHSIFRIELEYGDGLLKWVIYRELRDFVNLHTHYRVAGLAKSVEMPSFPKTSLPYFNLLRKERGSSKELSKSEFARSQRMALETYLLKLIRAFMFRPEANRLAKFLEISAASISFAARGGVTGKQGFLRISSPNNISRKAQGSIMLSSLVPRQATPKWFIVRESYIVAVADPGSAEVWDVFLFDQDFQLERPKRLYRQGLSNIRSVISPEDAERDQNEDDMIDAFEGGEKTEKGVMPMSKAKRFLMGRKKHADRPSMGDPQDPSTTDIANQPEEMQSTSQHTFYLNNAEIRLKLTAKSERQMDQFIASIERIAQKSPWAGRNRFDSFAPIRQNVSAKWLADGRDYYWELSRAVSMARKVIYIHDWWLSPELYLRRPPALNQQWRLDRLLQRKAQEGVKIYVILYKEVAQSFTPVDSQYTKNKLTELHPNIMVQRSPDSEARNLLWSHHEKLCVIDEAIVFMGGFDLCFGRWDTPQHSLVDDRPKGFEHIESAFLYGLQGDVEDYQIWPGKDYSNQRHSDFFNLNRPQDDMYDRNVVPRQPWHDFGVQLVGQPARDMSRHFIQRWNHLLRIKHHSRVMPFLTPPADFTAADLEKGRLQGTCETQILRSAGPWSIGTPKRIEHSIQNAYIKAIQLSEAFVYIENQYFSSSSVAENVVIENKIGDALVSRILRAHAEGMPWRACIILPLTPGYPMPLDSPDAAAVRMIMEAQARSIFRGEHSVFSRLRREGVDPDKYINFFSLRAWGKLQNGSLTSQDVYIHDKIMVVDDRLAIIGSANINERSQRGDRDSEVAVIIRDTDLIEGTMAGLPFKVGRFAHTMRVHLMQEHLGLDTDLLAARGGPQGSKATGTSEPVKEDGIWDPAQEQEKGNIRKSSYLQRPFRQSNDTDSITGHIRADEYKDAFASGKGTVMESTKELVEGAGQAVAGAVAQTGMLHAEEVPPINEQADTQQKMNGGEVDPSAAKPGPTVEERLNNEEPPHRDPSTPAYDNKTETRNKRASSVSRPIHLTIPNSHKNEGAVDGSDDELEDVPSSPAMNGDGTSPSRPSHVMLDQVKRQEAHRRPSFAETVLSQSTMSDEFSEGRARSSSVASNKDNFHFGSKKHRNSVSAARSSVQSSLPSKPPDITPEMFEDPLNPQFYESVWMKAAVINTEVFRKVFRCTPDDKCLTWAQFKQWDAWEKRHQKPARDANKVGQETGRADPSQPGLRTVSEQAALNDPKSVPAGTATDPTSIADQGFTVRELENFEKLLLNLRGNLVVFPTRFLETEAVAGNNLFARDRIQPMAVYD